MTPPWQLQGIVDPFGAYFAAHVCLGIHFSALVAGRRARPTHQPLSHALWARSQGLWAVQFRVLETQLQQIARRSSASSTPTTRSSPRRWPCARSRSGRSTAPPPTRSRPSAGLGYFTPFTPMFNATGQPAVSLPLFAGDDGLPLAVQLVGRPAGEGPLLALAAELEAAQPWAERRPRPA